MLALKITTACEHAETRHMGQFDPTQTWEVVSTSVSLLSPVRDAKAQPQPSKHTYTLHNTHITIFTKPSDNFLWFEMQPEIAAHTHSNASLSYTRSYDFGANSPKGIGFPPQMRGADAKERDTRGSNCIQSGTHTKICVHNHTQIHRKIYLLE